MTDMMLEVDDELRSQQIKAMWAKYGQWAIGLFVITVFATAVGVFWHNHVNSALEADTDRLLTVLQQDSADSKKILADMGELQKTTRAPLNSLIAMQQAQRLEQEDNAKAAQDIYQKIIDSKNAPAILHDLATLHRVRLGLIAKDKPETLLPMLEPLLTEKSAFRPSALEMKALLLQQQNKHAEANAIFKALSTDASAPATLRQRAQTLVRYEEKNAK